MGCAGRVEDGSDLRAVPHSPPQLLKLPRELVDLGRLLARDGAELMHFHTLLLELLLKPLYKKVKNTFHTRSQRYKRSFCFYRSTSITALFLLFCSVSAISSADILVALSCTVCKEKNSAFCNSVRKGSGEPHVLLHLRSGLIAF